MKKLYLQYICDDQAGEAQGIFDEDKNLLHFWFMDDCDFRKEYLNPLMKKLGYDVVVPTGKLDNELEVALTKAARNYGL